MNQLELAGDFHAATPAKSVESEADSATQTSSSANAQLKAFLPPPPTRLSEKRRLQSTDGTKPDNPEVDQEDDRGNQGELNARRESAACEPMVHYDGFDSVGIPKLAFGDDGDEDFVNFQSPVIGKPPTAGSSSWSPKCVSAVTQSDSDAIQEPSWSIQEFQQYLAMLELLQDVCGSSEGDEVSLSANSLGQMERLLTALLPSKV
ncbi:hypothetical protein PHYBOEH_004255 [Phytophthora boehmeriae]|uniref:Uncharacterized protein n=1 Tax=Phytophthora boehmeriae TaxID=109152 RepID=A0A8T1WRV0_9STRA|nr:hypothetical protein PHYBOEH_004255 [Phytophthora boehmeriae]